jgi:thymidylate synthase (FAD)
MKLIRPSYEIIEQQPGIQGIYDIIERCGKTSYKSEVKGGEDAKRFVEARTKERHGAVLEFGTVYLKIRIGSPMYDEHYMEEMSDVMFYKRNKYSKVVEEQDVIETDGKKFGLDVYYVTTNYRVLVENNRLEDIEAYGCDVPEKKHEKRYCVKFITDIGVGREFLRHRTMSMVQESTRYVNYSKEKFGESCTFVIPPWIGKDTLSEGEKVILWEGDWTDMSDMKIVKYGPHDNKNTKTDAWLSAMSSAEETYLILTNHGWTAQQARGVLPLSTKTEFVLSGFKDSWLHFFCLRSDIALTGKPHPQAQELANPLRDEFIERGYITEEELNERVKLLKDAEEKSS